MRIDNFLAVSGLCARRKVANFLQEQRAAIDDKIITEPGERFTTEQLANLTINGKHFKAGNKFYYFMLNKPEGYLSANSDGYGRPLAVNLIKESKQIRIYNVGRLDYNSCGLLLFTNDGAFTKIVSHPSSMIEKEYYVKVDKPIAKIILAKFKTGLNIDGEFYKIKNYHHMTNYSVNLILTEGKKREIRLLFKHFGYQVTLLKRLRIGGLKLGNLTAGSYRALTKEEIELITENL
ncbi:MAG: rRNA pseudouridine synthase [Spirochaetaceae bacterium]|nr:rRNA pseudouridine synthase [Spirochaetaceae bacterium]